MKNDRSGYCVKEEHKRFQLHIFHIFHRRFTWLSLLVIFIAMCISIASYSANREARQEAMISSLLASAETAQDSETSDSGTTAQETTWLLFDRLPRHAVLLIIRLAVPIFIFLLTLVVSLVRTAKMRRERASYRKSPDNRDEKADSESWEDDSANQTSEDDKYE